MRITPNLVPHAYSISKKVYEGKLTHTDGVMLLVGDGRMNKNSAADYINNFRYMMEGQRFTRTNNAFSVDYFLEHILQDYGASKLAKALSALSEHIKYYEGLPPKAQMLKMRGILK